MIYHLQRFIPNVCDNFDPNPTNVIGGNQISLFVKQLNIG